MEWLEVCSLSGHLSHSFTRLIVCDYPWSLFDSGIFVPGFCRLMKSVFSFSQMSSNLSVTNPMIICFYIIFWTWHVIETCWTLRSGLWVKAKKLFKFFCFSEFSQISIIILLWLFKSPCNKIKWLMSFSCCRWHYVCSRISITLWCPQFVKETALMNIKETNSKIPT